MVYFASTSFSQRILNNLNSLRVNKNLCDVEIISGSKSGKVLYAHRNVLAASSPYFNAMFTGDMVEKNRTRIVIQSLDSNTLECLINFIYTGEIYLSKENVQEIMVAGDMIELNEVVEICSKYLIQELDSSNAIGIRQFAAIHNWRMLQVSSEKFIFDKFVEVMNKSEEFLELSMDSLIYFLSSEHLKIDSEYQVFVSAMKWINYNIPDRRRFVFDILQHIRLPLIPTKLLDLYQCKCNDLSIKVALTSIKEDILQRKGCLVKLSAEPRFAAKKNIFVFGGSKREASSAWSKPELVYRSVEMFDTFNQRWKQVASMKIGRICPGLAALRGKIYVCGGEFESEILANGEVYDPQDNSWSEMASMITPRCEFGMTALGGYIYAFGGWIGVDIGDSIERYDPVLNEWKAFATMKTPRFSMGVYAYEGLIYIVGGCTHSRQNMQELVSYNPETGEWTKHAEMLGPRSQMGCAILNDHLYVVGGTDRYNDVLQSVERYSFRTNKWEEIPPMIQQRASPSVASSNGKLYVFGGDKVNDINFYRSRATISFSEVYDPLSNKWSETISLPDSRSEARAIVT